MGKIDAINHILQSGNEYETSPYGYRTDPITGKKSSFHSGEDIVSSKYGVDYIVALTDGEVIDVRNNVTWRYVDDENYQNYSSSIWAGNYVKIKHNNGYTTKYCHLKLNSIPVKVGDRVAKGQVIGFMGTSGYSTGSHCHFEIAINGATDSPRAYLEGSKTVPGLVENPVVNPPVEFQSKFSKGQQVIFNGILYYNPDGGGAGESRSNFVCTISSNSDIPIVGGKFAPYNINNGLGWVREQDLQPYSPPTPQPDPTPVVTEAFPEGTRIRIIGHGNGSSYGKSGTAYGIGWVRYVTKIWPGRPFPYQIGYQGKTDTASTTGFYTAGSLQKI